MLADEELPQDSDASRSPRTALPDVNLPPPSAGFAPPSMQPASIGFRPHTGAPLTATVSIKAQPTSPQAGLDPSRALSPTQPLGRAAAAMPSTQPMPAPR